MIDPVVLPLNVLAFLLGMALHLALEEGVRLCRACAQPHRVARASRCPGAGEHEQHPSRDQDAQRSERFGRVVEPFISLELGGVFAAAHLGEGTADRDPDRGGVKTTTPRSRTAPEALSYDSLLGVFAGRGFFSPRRTS